MKSQLLNQAARGKSDLAVLDFGCGFGGDIKKWVHARIQCAVGVDPSLSAVEEARKRAHGHRMYHFVHDPNPLDFVRSLPENCFDIITFHFAVHYYPREQQGETIKELHRVLRPGGTLVATFLEAKRVFAYKNNECLQIKMVSPSEIEVSMADSIYFHSIGGISKEHLCFSTFLTNQTTEYFDQINVIDFETFYRQNKVSMTDQERAASFLHVAMVFIK